MTAPSMPAVGIDKVPSQAPGDPAPSGGGVTLVEQGFRPNGDGSDVSVGAIVRNSSTQTAYRTKVSFTPYAKDGAAVPYAGNQPMLEIPVLVPGERVPLGMILQIAESNLPDGKDYTTARVDIKVVQTTWTTAGEILPVTFSLDPVDPNGVGPMKATAVSPYCDRLYFRGITMVYRDRAGAIVGGSLDVSNYLSRNRDNAEKLCAPGTNTVDNLRVDPQFAKPKGIAATEYALHCDPAKYDYKVSDTYFPLN
ncbi:hypothetical protein [Winogradskya consettensis]|uniref:hypothetical protein n=1 Tax=Winogradskya consettensis TaxID=113560 RepID=UPI001BB42879|nr:hypothetical protein [Actinoplanes consettensis]